ncbi:hypothetical protein B0H10DRAFT_2076049, partial [Mycena sp. CBHHK59/15]
MTLCSIVVLTPGVLNRTRAYCNHVYATWAANYEIKPYLVAEFPFCGRLVTVWIHLVYLLIILSLVPGAILVLNVCNSFFHFALRGFFRLTLIKRVSILLARNRPDKCTVLLALAIITSGLVWRSIRTGNYSRLHCLKVIWRHFLLVLPALTYYAQSYVVRWPFDSSSFELT